MRLMLQLCSFTDFDVFALFYFIQLNALRCHCLVEFYVKFTPGSLFQQDAF